MRENKCNKVIFAGKIDKPNLSKLKLDITGIYYLPRIIKAYKKGDAAILKELINILALEKVKVVKSTFFTPAGGSISYWPHNCSVVRPAPNHQD